MYSIQGCIGRVCILPNAGLPLLSFMGGKFPLQRVGCLTLAHKSSITGLLYVALVQPRVCGTSLESPSGKQLAIDYHEAHLKLAYHHFRTGGCFCVDVYTFYRIVTGLVYFPT